SLRCLLPIGSFFQAPPRRPPSHGRPAGHRLAVYIPGAVEALKLSGTVYGGWSSTNDAVMEFRLLEIRVIDVGQRQGYFDLYGRWLGTVLVMDDRNRANGLFRSGLKVEHASITLNRGK